MFDKLFGKGKKKEDPAAEPDICFGRYSDNNKPLAKVNRWTEADNLFKEKKYPESLAAFFDYLRDEEADNVHFSRTEDGGGRFHFFQGSKVVRGHFGDRLLQAEVTLARMPQPSVPVMRRLLEMNFNLYYSRFALDEERLCMRFDSDLSTASPSKLYYGLKELATKADKQDDLLVQDFTILQHSDSDHTVAVPDAEKAVKFSFFQRSIQETLDRVAALDPDKYSGGIAYLLLALVYRLDYLVCPEGRLLNELERIGGIYFKKDERPVAEKNRDMAEELRKLMAWDQEQVYRNLFRSQHTFAIVAPQPHKTIADSIYGAHQNLAWYRDNNQPDMVAKIAEYGLSYCQYSYSLPAVLTELYHLFMQVNYADFFRELGFVKSYYDPAANRFDEEGIRQRILSIQEKWREKFPGMDFKVANLSFASLAEFDLSFTNEIQHLNMEPK